MILFPTLTRTWMLRGQQQKIRAPGVHPPKRHECAATDWRTGMIVRIRAEKRNAEVFCRLIEKCMARSAHRKRRVIMVVDRARIHTPKGSRLVAKLLKNMVDDCDCATCQVIRPSACRWKFSGMIGVIK